MKTRYGFVSNSSSSSFVIARDKLTSAQVKLIQDHCEDGKWDCWNITVGEYTIEGATFMDNFNMHSYLEKIGIDMKHVDWDR